MIEFDLSPGQKAFLTGCWLGSALFTLVVLAGEKARRLMWRKP